MTDAAVIKNGAQKAKASHVWTRDPFNFYVEPFESSRTLFRAEAFGRTVYDPACGLGRIVSEARAAGYEAWGTDIVVRNPECLTERDFLDATESPHRPDAIVCNPPFKHCSQAADFVFVRRALDEAAHKVALLLPANWHCGLRVSKFLKTAPFYRYYVISPRPSMPPGAVIQAGIKPGNGRQDFAWYLFLKGFTGNPTMHWLTPDTITTKENERG